ncbi:hypothetical protein Pan153_37440 [Gimesia panareensis]|uniref:Uncharacterized protein n=1 Tax=Gimesia panareensis TaxID=2527978 RepID=A0A518FRV7_9PLAN|nr:hypothetical protein [Gimesia panareensis]QDV19081.1 hypothetical protein Pan153_37440 [Gimesia panareensis]
MKQSGPLLFLSGYFLVGWVVVWILVMLLDRGDPKFAGKVGFHYGIWISVYFPIAITGTIALTRMKGSSIRRIIVTMLSLLAVLVVMFFSVFNNIDWLMLLVEYIGFAIAFWLLARSSNSKEIHP